MKNIKILSVVVSVLMLFSACRNAEPPVDPAPENASADVVETTPTASPAPTPKTYTEVIEISTAQELVAMSREYGENVEAYKDYLYVLTNDIDMSGVENFVPIGMLPPYVPDPVEGFPDISYSAPNRKSTGFIATFDGQGHTVKNLTLNYKGNAEGKKGYGCMGFFMAVSDGGVVKNLNIENITINGIGANPWHSANCGGLAGYFAGYAENCHVNGRIDTISCGGGFVGRAGEDAKVYNCTADVDISGCWYTAGFVGYIESGDDLHFKDCASFGSLTAYIPYTNKDDIWNVGGFGGMLSSGVYENCHAQTELIILDPAHSVGGMFAFADEKNTEFINCTYHPAYTGNWDLLFSINHVTCHGNYAPYTFTADSSRNKFDYINNYSGVDTDKIIAISKDNRYFIYESDSWGEADGGELEYTLKDTQTNKEKLLGKVWKSRNSGAGFFQNGDAYIFDEHNGLKIFDTDMDNTDVIFDSQNNFPCGDNIDGNGTERYVFAIRRDPEKMDYIVIYGEFNNTDGTPKKYPYLVGLLDKDGRLVQTHQLPAEFYTTDFYGVHMFKSGETEIEFYTTMKDKELFRVRFDYVNGAYTEIK